MRNWSAVLNSTVSSKSSRRSSSATIDVPTWDSVDVPDSVRSRLVEECEAMARHALGSGKAPPAWVLEAIERERADTDRRASVILQTIDETQNGEAPGPGRPRPALISTSAGGLDELVRAHATLSRLIAPATPRGILLLSRGHREGRLKALGPVRLIRQMLVVVIVMLVMFVVLAISPDVNSTSGDIFRSSGLPLLFNELFYIAAGGLGAAFYALFTAYRYIAEGMYDTTYESSYWIRFILGLIAGVLLPSLIPISSDGGGSSVRRPLLALLGGFSAALLYRILQRFVQTVEALAEGDSRPVEMARSEAATARAVAQVGEDRLVLVGDLVRLRDGLATGESPDHLRASIDKLVAELVPRGVVPEGTDVPKRPEG
ncbi:MAG: hypothetical protein ACXVXL_00280 [Solirubrobacteraceae bacterium]